MSFIRAIVIDPTITGQLAIQEVEAPQIDQSEVLTGLNFYTEFDRRPASEDLAWLAQKGLPATIAHTHQG